MHYPPEVLSLLKAVPMHLTVASPENDIYALGSVAHQILYQELFCDNLGVPKTTEDKSGRPQPKVDEIVWGASGANATLLGLFKMCCADNAKDRPSITEVRQTVEAVAKKT